MMHEGREGLLDNNQDGRLLESAVQESVVRINILSFFQANPHTIDTAAGLARRLHRSPEEIELALDTLVRIGIIQKRVYGKAQLYKLKNGELIASFFDTQRGDALLE